MKKRKIIIVQISVLVIIHIAAFVLLYGFDKKLGSDILNDFPEIRAILPSDERDTARITLGGVCIQYDVKKAVVWYIIEKENDEKYYLPTICNCISFSKYEFVEICEAKSTNVSDVMYAEAFGKYSIFINNENCIGYEAAYDDGVKYTVDIKSNEYPYYSFVNDISSCKFIYK